MSEHKYQTDRPNPCKPSVVKEYGMWWAKVYDQDMVFRGEGFLTHAEAIAKSNEYAAGDKK